ncbi:MAG: GWxTD domain-containing protein [Candidatus Aminicenantes bacterium]|nr:GWxTD domain-containing protein [Candidatus Aminicenantes bacterium]
MKSIRVRRFSRPATGALPVVALSLLLLPLLASCSAGARRVRDLPPEERQFLSEVRYLISKKERRIFRSTPAEERPKFIEEFWKQRDPDPTTEENEFRDEYYRRIGEANRLFRGGDGGWLSDRGRILILLGEPERRDVYPTGYSFYEPPVEIWFYGMFPVIFVDYQREGIYRLDPSSARRISMLNIAQMELKPQGIERDVRLFDFTLSFRALGPGKAKLQMQVPYRVTNLVLNEANRAYETRLKLSVRILGEDGSPALEKEELRLVSVTNDMLAGLGKDLTLEFPFELPAGSYVARVSLENTADGTQARKELKIRF